MIYSYYSFGTLQPSVPLKVPVTLLLGSLDEELVGMFGFQKLYTEIQFSG
jgi:hypothetical protein